MSENSGDNQRTEDQQNPYDTLDDRLNDWRARWKHRPSKWFSVPIEVFALLLGMLTLIAVVGTGWIAYRNWRALETSNAMNRNAYVTSQRAYVTVTGLDIQPVPDDKMWPSIVRPFWRVVPIIVNSGNTPTKNMWWTAMGGDECGQLWWLFPTKDVSCDRHPMIQTFKDLQTATRNRLTLGPRQEVRPFGLSTGSLTAPTRAGIIAGRQQLFIHGILIYEDFLSTAVHVTRYCFTLWHNGAILGPDGISFSQCGGKTNCADEECDGYEQLKTLVSDHTGLSSPLSP